LYNKVRIYLVDQLIKVYYGF